MEITQAMKDSIVEGIRISDGDEAAENLRVLIDLCQDDEKMSRIMGAVGLHLEFTEQGVVLNTLGGAGTV
jgi:hypothetical protein